MESKQKTMDLTAGHPLKQILIFSVPLVFGTIFQQLYSFADTVIVGRCLGTDALAAVGATSSLHFLILGFVQGACVGFGIPVAQSFGSKNQEEMCRFLWNGTWICVIISLLLSLGSVLLTDTLLVIMNTPEEIFSGGYIPQLYGMTAGAYDELTGSLELEKMAGVPEVFVIAGCGLGTPVFRRLQREGIPFAAGILWENDLDYPAARALAARLITEKSFHPFSEEKRKEAEALIDRCSRVICAPGLEQKLEGSLAEGLKELIQYAKRS